MWCLPLVPADSIRAEDSKEKSLCAMSRSSLFRNVASEYPWSESETMNLELNVARLPATSLGLHKLASWRLQSYFFTNIRFLVLPKIRTKVLMRPPKIPKLQRNAESIPSPTRRSHIKPPLSGNKSFISTPTFWVVFTKTEQRSSYGNQKMGNYQCMFALAPSLCLQNIGRYEIMTGLPLRHHYADPLRPKAMRIPSIDIQNAKVLER